MTFWKRQKNGVCKTISGCQGLGGKKDGQDQGFFRAMKLLCIINDE